jgi:hypothetical protein
MSRIGLFVAVLVAVSSFALGQSATPAASGSTKTPVITRHQIHQKARIRQGVRSGKLTRAEAAKLRHEQKMIKKEKRVAKADAKVTRAERAKIRHDQKKAGKDIFRLKHNKRNRAN